MPWGHLMVLLDKLADAESRDWYAAQALEHGWSRNVLVNQIKNQTHRRAGAAPSNFTTQRQTPPTSCAGWLGRFRATRCRPSRRPACVVLSLPG